MRRTRRLIACLLPACSPAARPRRRRHRPAAAQAPRDRLAGPRRSVPRQRRGQPSPQPAAGDSRAATCAMPTGSATSSATPITRPSARRRGRTWRRWRAIDRDALSADERVAYDVFKWQREHGPQRPRGRGLRRRRGPADRPFQRLPHLLRRLQLGRGHRAVQDASRIMRTASPGSTISSGSLDGAIVRMEQGLAAGVVQPKLVMANVARAARRDARRRGRGKQLLPAGRRISRPRSPQPTRRGCKAAYAAVDLDRDPAGADPASRLRPRPLSAAARATASGSRT